MAVSWIKSLQCKSNAFHDVHQPSPSLSCKNSYQNLKDVVDKPKPKPKPKHVKRSTSVKPKPDTIVSPRNNRVRRTVSAPINKPKPKPKPETYFHTFSELQMGHPSRNVVEIIFHTRWDPNGFSGRVETVLKIHNMTQTVSQFEEYRNSVKTRVKSGSNNYTARCKADGNEMMRFRCLGPTTTTGGVLLDSSVKGSSTSASICTYSGSSAAHESVGGGKGRRAMLVCRVIAGRVLKRVGLEPDPSIAFEFDSVSKDNGELLVLDNRAVLPCFLVIYKL